MDRVVPLILKDKKLNGNEFCRKFYQAGHKKEQG